MCTRLLVVFELRPQCPLQSSLVQDNDVVYTLRSGRADEPLAVRILLGRVRRGEYFHSANGACRFADGGRRLHLDHEVGILASYPAETPPSNFKCCQSCTGFSVRTSTLFGQAH